MEGQHRDGRHRQCKGPEAGKCWVGGMNGQKACGARGAGGGRALQGRVGPVLRVVGAMVTSKQGDTWPQVGGDFSSLSPDRHPLTLRAAGTRHPPVQCTCEGVGRPRAAQRG